MNSATKLQEQLEVPLTPIELAELVRTVTHPWANVRIRRLIWQYERLRKEDALAIEMKRWSIQALVRMEEVKVLRDEIQRMSLAASNSLLPELIDADEPYPDHLGLADEIMIMGQTTIEASEKRCWV